MDRTVYRGVAATEVVGGAIGIVLGVITLARVRPSRPLEMAALTIGFLGPFAFHMAAGALLWARTALGYRLSVVAQALMVPRLVTPLLTVYYFSAANLSVGLQYWWRTADPAFPPGARGMGPWFAAQVGAGGQFAVLQGPPAVAVGVNFVALALLILLLRARRAEARAGSAEIPLAVSAPSA